MEFNQLISIIYGYLHYREFCPGLAVLLINLFIIHTFVVARYLTVKYNMCSLRLNSKEWKWIIMSHFSYRNTRYSLQFSRICSWVNSSGLAEIWKIIIENQKIEGNCTVVIALVIKLSPRTTWMPIIAELTPCLLLYLRFLFRILLQRVDTLLSSKSECLFSFSAIFRDISPFVCPEPLCGWLDAPLSDWAFGEWCTAFASRSKYYNRRIIALVKWIRRDLIPVLQLLLSSRLRKIFGNW